MRSKEYLLELGGKKITATLSDLAERAGGSAMLSMGETVVLATATYRETYREGTDFLFLTVDYEERFYASGEILGSRYTRREGKPSDTAILTARMIDRSLRPLFPDLKGEIHIVITVLAIGDDDPDILSLNAASLALALSSIPWAGPIGAVRVGKNSGIIFNPGFLERDGGLNAEMVICGKEGGVVMLEGVAGEAKESEIIEMAKKGLVETAKLENFQKEIIEKEGKKKKTYEEDKLGDGAEKLFQNTISPLVKETAISGSTGHHELNNLLNTWLGSLKEHYPKENTSVAKKRFKKTVKEVLLREAIEKKKRADGRGVDDIRAIEGRAGGISEKLHGVGIFYRGETHVLSVLTLGNPSLAQSVEGIEEKERRSFMHHYNFPPFAAGEPGRVGAPNRREIGHGNLVEKALLPIIPKEESFPYTIRLVSESLSSNGSTSMASVCASSIALMDGGVPIARHTAGISIGLFFENDKSYEIISDVQGPEDEYGHMDLKIAGTERGITALQLDIKLQKISLKILEEAVEKGLTGRMAILKEMVKTIPQPRSGFKGKVTPLTITKIPKEFIGLVIGEHGKTINRIKDESGVKSINIENDGKVLIGGEKNAAQKAVKAIEEMVVKGKSTPKN